jgi:hypothetical protein
MNDFLLKKEENFNLIVLMEFEVVVCQSSPYAIYSCNNQVDRYKLTQIDGYGLGIWS